MIINFDIAQTKAYQAGASVLPAGDYVVEIVSETPNQPLRNGNGTALVFEYQVLNGEFAGQRIRDWLNLGHSSPDARGIAQRRLKAIGEAVGVPVFTDTQQLFKRPFIVSLSLSEFQGRQRNSVDAYKPAQQVAAPSQPQPASNNAPFWS